MVVSRRGPKGGLVTPFGLAFLTFIVVPNAIGSQDLAALVARQPVIAERPASRFSLIRTAHGATFTMPRPVSAAMPPSLSYTLAGLDTSYAGITGSIRERLLGEALLTSPTTSTCRSRIARSRATVFRPPRSEPQTCELRQRRSARGAAGGAARRRSGGSGNRRAGNRRAAG